MHQSGQLNVDILKATESYGFGGSIPPVGVRITSDGFQRVESGCAGHAWA